MRDSQKSSNNAKHCQMPISEKKSIIANFIERPHHDNEVLKKNTVKNYFII